MDKKKFAISIMLVTTIFLLNALILSPYTQKNAALKSEIEYMDSGKMLDNKTKVAQADSSETDSYEEKDTDTIGERGENLDLDNNGKSKLEKNSNRDFYQEASMDPNIVSIEKASQENENKYRIMLRGENKDFIKFINYLDKQNKKVKIDQIMYNKYEKTGEYTILVNLFPK